MLGAARSRRQATTAGSLLRRRNISAGGSNPFRTFGLSTDRFGTDDNENNNNETTTRTVPFHEKAMAVYAESQRTRQQDLVRQNSLVARQLTDDSFSSSNAFSSSSKEHNRRLKQQLNQPPRLRYEDGCVTATEDLDPASFQWQGFHSSTSLALSSGRNGGVIGFQSPLVGLGSLSMKQPTSPSFSNHHQISFFTTSFSSKTPTPVVGGEKKNPSRVLSRSKIPTPNSAPPEPANPLSNLPAPKNMVQKGLDMLISLAKTIFVFLWKLPGNIWFYTFNHEERKKTIASIKDTINHEINHYWVGSKLLWADIRTARDLLNKTLNGSSLTRRERKQMLRTVSDIFRLVPFSMFIIIPMAEFALPFALRIFPNLLPSTFQDSLKAEENMKREVQSRISMAVFFQDTLEELAKEQKRKAKKRKEELKEAGVEIPEDGTDTIDQQESSARSMLEFLEKARSGEMIPPDVIIRYANYFQDDLTLDNMPRMQLINMCKYMNVPPYGSDAFLRFQLRHKIRVLKEDDQRILWEGIESLTKMELREACQERGMRSTGLSKDAYKDSLQQWLDLSVNKNVPIALLIMSRTFFLREDVFQPRGAADTQKTDTSHFTGLADAISGLDKEVLNEVILEVATSEEKKSDPTIKALKLEVLTQQNELIRKEQEAREAAAAKKKENAPAAPAEKKEAAPTEADTTTTEKTFVDSKETAPEVQPLPAPSSDAAKVAQAVKEAMDDKISGVVQEVAKEVPPVTSAQETTTKEEDRKMSTEELDTLRQLLTDNPVLKEREEFEKLKAAMKGEDKDKQAKMKEVVEEIVAASDALKDSGLDQAQKAKISEAFHEAVESSHILEGQKEEEEEAPDPIVQRLQKRIESMVDKIEVQLSDVQVKIGDKLHFLDKDRDGVLSKEEVASVLQQVFKRKLTVEEALEIAEEMDENHDGIFTVDELLQWIDETKLVKFVEEGREAEMDQMMAKQAESSKDGGSEESKPAAKA